MVKLGFLVMRSGEFSPEENKHILSCVRNKEEQERRQPMGETSKNMAKIREKNEVLRRK
jgi:hypothetical protein